MLLVVPVAMLLIIGLGAMLSASSVISIRETGDHLFYFKRQIIWVALGIVTFVAARCWRSRPPGSGQDHPV